MPSSDFLYATCAPGLESLLAGELRDLGAVEVNTAGAGVRFGNTLESAYRACLWSRVANRVLLPLLSGPSVSPEDLYTLVQQIDWSEHVSVDGTLAVDFFTAHSALTHSQYGALKVKDAIVDQFRAATGRRPNVDRETPDISVNVYLYRNKARIALDLSGASLHRRGYRQQGGLAPLKENLAAALLLGSDWPALAERGGSFVDPLCGSGTLLIEAAMIARHQAPGLHRQYFGFLGWRGHQKNLWEQLVAEARNAIRDVRSIITGCDSDNQMVNMAKQNVQAAGVDTVVTVHRQPIESGPPSILDNTAPGLLLSNPPYGERLAGDASFYVGLGRSLSRRYAGWTCGLFTAVQAPLQRARLPLKLRLSARNGGIDCALMLGEIPAMAQSQRQTVWPDTAQIGSARKQDTAALTSSEAATATVETTAAEPQSTSSPGVESIDITAFVNRLRKNQRSLKSWLSREGIKAWRAYDADLPEFAVAIDVYDCTQRHLMVQEYQAPATVNAIMAEARLQALLAVLPDVFGVHSDHIHVRLRERKSGISQYEKQTGAAVTDMLEERSCVYELNFSDYLDTGLFLDHRKLRRYIQDHAAGLQLLNLFAYTGSVTVAAAKGGAAGSVSVDFSNRYCQWAERNLQHNEIDLSRHKVVRSDVSTWLAAQKSEPRFDLILLDPPTFSNSTGLEADWNVQRDHVACIRACLQLLKPEGLLIFSNNFRRFKLDMGALVTQAADPAVEGRSRWSIDRDFKRNQRIHQCWFIRH